MWCLRVRSRLSIHGLDLPELTSLHLGWSAFAFNAESTESTLVMQSKSCEKGMTHRLGEPHNPRLSGSEQHYLQESSLYHLEEWLRFIRFMTRHAFSRLDCAERALPASSGLHRFKWSATRDNEE